MQKHIFNKRGPQLIGAIVIAVVLVAVGAFAYHGHHTTGISTSSSAEHAAESQSTHAANTAPIKPFQAGHTAQEATSLVQSTYDEYLAAVHQAGSHDGIPASLTGLTAVKNNLTSDLYAEATASPNGDAFSCAASFVPDAYTASSTSSSATSAIVAVKIIKSADGSTATNGMTATVDLYSLKISSVGCL